MPTIGGTIAPDDASVITIDSKKSTVSIFSQKVIGALLANLSVEDREGFLLSQGLELADYEVFIPAMEDTLIDEESLSGDETDNDGSVESMKKDAVEEVAEVERSTEQTQCEDTEEVGMGAMSTPNVTTGQSGSQILLPGWSGATIPVRRERNKVPP